MNSKLLILFTASGPLSIASILWLLRKRGTIPEKIFWSIIALIPLLGPLFVGAFFNSTENNPDSLQDKRDWDTLPGHYWEKEDTNHLDND